MIGRRAFLSGLAATGLAARALAQPALPRLGILSPASIDAAVSLLVRGPFLAALAEMGYVNSRNIAIVERFGEGDAARLPQLAVELVILQPRVIFTNTNVAATALARATRTIPIVVGPAGEHVMLDLAGNLARPTGNVTGLVLTSPEIDDKCLDLLIEAAPRAARVGVLFNPDNPGQADYPARLRNAARAPALTLLPLRARGPAEVAGALAHGGSQEIDALFVADDANLAANAESRRSIIRFAEAARLPLASSHLEFARVGALLAMGPSIPALARRGAAYVDRILKGAAPGDLPVERPTIINMIVNLKTAKALGMDIPPAVLARANEVIE